VIGKRGEGEGGAKREEMRDGREGTPAAVGARLLRGRGQEIGTREGREEGLILRRVEEGRRD
jgi:hypothetical protein